MNIWFIVGVSLIILGIVAGGYLFMFLHVMRSDPKELEYRGKNGEKNNLIPYKYKNQEDLSHKES